MYSGFTDYPFETNLPNYRGDRHRDWMRYHEDNSSFRSASLDFLSTLTFDRRAIKLIKPMQLITNFNQNGCVMKNEDLNIVSIESTYSKCLESFQEQVIFIHEEYGCARDNELTKDAIKLKKKINLYI